MTKLRAFILYSDVTKDVVPMSLLRRKFPPKGRGVTYLEIPNGCCALTPFTPIEGSSKKRLRAFVKIDRRGNTMSGPIIRANRPRDPFFKEVPFNLCCQEFLQNIVFDPNQETNQTGLIGENITISPIFLSGNSMTYQWYTGIDTSTPISGETDKDLTVTLADLDPQTYTVEATNELGSATKTFTINAA